MNGDSDENMDENSNQNIPEDSDENMSDDEGYDSDSDQYLPRPIRDRNFRDAERREAIAEDADRLQKVVDTADKLENNAPVTPGEKEVYDKELEGTNIESVRHRLGDKLQEMDTIDEKMDKRREAGYELSEEESSDSDYMDIDEKHSNKPWSLPQSGESSRSNQQSHVDPNVGYSAYTNPPWSINENVPPVEGGVQSSANINTQPPVEMGEESSVNSSTQRPVHNSQEDSVNTNPQLHGGGNTQTNPEDNLQSSVNDSVEEFAFLFVFTNSFSISFLSILYRLYKINYFKILMFYYKNKILRLWRK